MTKYRNTKSQFFTVTGAIYAERDRLVNMADKVRTEAEYVQFVREWKPFYADVTETIREARAARQNAFGVNTSGTSEEFRASIIPAKQAAHSTRQSLGANVGRVMSDLRFSMKLKLKAGAFPATEKVAEPA